MVQKLRSPGNTQVSISLGEELLDQIDRRAASLGWSRSVYLATLARNDLSDGGDVVVREINNPLAENKRPDNLNETTPGLKEDTVRKVVDTLKKKIPTRYPGPSRPKHPS